jgi:hypothetical protein
MEFVDSGGVGNIACVLNEALYAFKGVNSFDDDTLEPQATKEGLFEWIVGFDGISEYLQPLYTGVQNPQGQDFTSHTIYRQNVLVIGCGTSTLSQCIADYRPPESTPPKDAFLAGKVVSIDNDPGMIDHMKKMSAMQERVAVIDQDPDTTVAAAAPVQDDKVAMEWLVYDIVENDGALADSSHTGAYDLCVDKGTFDAVVTEGAVFTMLADIHRLLRYGGAYFLCSIRQSLLLERLLSVPVLGWDVSLFCPEKKIAGSTEQSSGYTIAICRKVRNPNIPLIDGVSLHEEELEGALSPAQLRELQAQEQEVMDSFFKEASPLLTAEVEAGIRSRFGEALAAFASEPGLSAKGTQQHVPFSGSSKGDTLPLRCCYDVMFPRLNCADGDLGVDYTYDLFLEDLDSFARGDSEDDCRSGATSPKEVGQVRWGVEQCIAFLREMQ